MNKRVAAGLLWFFAGWYLGAMIAFHVGISDALGPILGALFAAFVVMDPIGRIWSRSRSAPRSPLSGCRSQASATSCPATDLARVGVSSRPP